MTDDDVKRIAENDQKFREHVVRAIARIEACGDADREDIRGVRHTLYGTDGMSGLVDVVSTLKKDAGLWNKGLAIAQGMIAIALIYLGFRK